MDRDRIHTAEWSARLERMMDQYRAATNRRRLQMAMKQWRTDEAQQALAKLEKPPERIH
jgi:DNA-binding transcriptional regulator YbjK